MSATLEAPVAPPRPSAAEKPAFRFRILSGTHYHAIPLVDEDGNVLVDEVTGKPRMKDVAFGPGRKAGDIVQTTQRLDRLLNKHSKVVQLLDESNDDKVTQIAELEDRNRTLLERIKKQVYAMDVRQLTDYCEAEDWDYDNTVDRDRLIRIVLSNLGVQ